MLKIGLIGCGAIASTIIKSINNKLINCKVIGVYDKNNDKAEKLSKLSNSKNCKNIDELVNLDLDVVVECASIKAVEEACVKSLNNNKNIIVMSVGAFADKNLFIKLYNIAKIKNKKIYIPSGAIAGIDALKTASIGKINEVSLITTKPIEGLSQTLEKKGINIENIKEPITIFEGTVFEAIKEFPQNINVSVVLSIATKIPAKVKIIVNPHTKLNKHEIIVKGEIGTIKTIVENNPCKDNPKTSLLAPYSVIRLLKDLSEPIVIGT